MHNADTEILNHLHADLFFYLLEKHTGLSFGPEKYYLLNSRLSILAKKHGFTNEIQLLAELTASPVGSLHWLCFEAMTTQETFFFRDRFCFDNIRNNMMPEILNKRRNTKKINIWSSGTSTGQEAYSLAILLHEEFPETNAWDIQILATDISHTVLSRAADGVYKEDEVFRGLSQPQIYRHFEKTPDNSYRIDARHKKSIRFKYLNLIENWHHSDKMDIVLLRNVLIYFNQEQKDLVLNKIVANFTADGGYLILGSSENIINKKTYIKRNCAQGFFYECRG